jgi:hypothetical protein
VCGPDCDSPDSDLTVTCLLELSTRPLGRPSASLHSHAVSVLSFLSPRPRAWLRFCSLYCSCFLLHPHPSPHQSLLAAYKIVQNMMTFPASTASFRCVLPCECDSSLIACLHPDPLQWLSTAARASTGIHCQRAYLTQTKLTSSHGLDGHQPLPRPQPTPLSQALHTSTSLLSPWLPGASTFAPAILTYHILHCSLPGSPHPHPGPSLYCSPLIEWPCVPTAHPTGPPAWISSSSATQTVLSPSCLLACLPLVMCAARATCGSLMCLVRSRAQ